MNNKATEPLTLDKLKQYTELSNYRNVPIAVNSYLPEFMPVRTLSRKVDVTDEYRAEINKWLITIFGMQRTAFIVQGKLVVHPNTKRVLDIKVQERK